MCITVLLEFKPRPEEGCHPQQLLFLRYDLGDSLRLDNKVPAGRAHRFTVTAYNKQSTTTNPSIRGMKLWTSTDDGTTWQPARAVPDGRGTDGERAFRVIARYPKLADTEGTVSLKAEAWDASGNRIEQRIDKAFPLVNPRDPAPPG